MDSDNDSSSDYYLVGNSAGGWNKIIDAELNVLASGTFASETDSINSGNSITLSLQSIQKHQQKLISMLEVIRLVRSFLLLMQLI